MTYPPDVLHENRTVQDAIDYALEIEASLDPAANRLGLESRFRDASNALRDGDPRVPRRPMRFFYPGRGNLEKKFHGITVDNDIDGIREVSDPREELLAFGNVLVLVFETADVRFELMDAVHDLRCPLLEFLFIEKPALERIQQSVTFYMELRQSLPGVVQLG